MKEKYNYPSGKSSDIIMGSSKKNRQFNVEAKKIMEEQYNKKMKKSTQPKSKK